MLFLNHVGDAVVSLAGGEDQIPVEVHIESSCETTILLFHCIFSILLAIQRQPGSSHHSVQAAE